MDWLKLLARLREHRARVGAQVQELKQALDLIDRKMALYDEWIRKHGAGGAQDL